MTPATFAKICDALGGKTETAVLVGKSRRVVHWYLEGRAIPAEVQSQLVTALYDRAYKITELARSIKLPATPKKASK